MKKPKNPKSEGTKLTHKPDLSKISMEDLTLELCNRDAVFLIFTRDDFEDLIGSNITQSQWDRVKEIDVAQEAQSIYDKIDDIIRPPRK